jgi:hypothetical protein
VKEKLTDMKLELNTDKTKITNLYHDRALFLGVQFFMSRIYTYREYWNKNRKRNYRFEAPLTRIIKKLSNEKFLVNGKSAPRFVWMFHTHDQILHLYNSVVRGYLNYYSFVHNYNSVVQLMHTLVKGSCAKLLAAKYSLRTQAKVYTKFGSLMQIKDKKERWHGFLPAKYGETQKIPDSKTFGK